MELMMAPKEVNGIIDISVGQQLANLRKQHNLNQTQIGDILGVSYQQVQKYENGKARVNGVKLMKLAAEFNTTVSYFFETHSKNVTHLIGPNPKDQLSQSNVPVNELAKMISIFMRISEPKLRETLIQTAQEFSQINSAS